MGTNCHLDTSKAILVCLLDRFVRDELTQTLLSWSAWVWKIDHNQIVDYNMVYGEYLSFWEWIDPWWRDITVVYCGARCAVQVINYLNYSGILSWVLWLFSIKSKSFNERRSLFYRKRITIMYVMAGLLWTSSLAANLLYASLSIEFMQKISVQNLHCQIQCQITD